jgi:hypothetical protein
MTLAIIGCVRAHNVMELRDRYRELLAPGRGKRVTTSGLYRFSNDVQRLSDYEWPEGVFSALGEDDEYDEGEHGERGAPVAGSTGVPSGPLKPTIPPPTPAPAVATSTEVLVMISTSDTVRAEPDSERGAWKLQVLEESRGLMLIVLLPQAMDRRLLVTELVRLADFKWGEKPTLLVLPKRERKLADEVNSAVGRHVAGIMRVGVASFACMRWGEAFLRFLRRELELVGESMPTAAELAEMKATRLVSSHADPVEDWQKQRDELEKLVKKILVHRGRWRGPVEIVERPARTLGSEARDLPKLKRTVTKLEAGNRTSYGDALYGIADAMLAWRADKITAEAAALHAGRSYIEYLFRTAHDAAKNGGFHLVMELEGTIGRGTAEAELLGAGVLRLLSGPFEPGRPARESSPRPQWPAYGARLAPSGWFNAWWCVVTAKTPEAFSDSRWVPREASLDHAAGSGLPDGVKVRVNHSLVPLERTPAPDHQSWVNTWDHACLDQAGALVSWLSGWSRYAHASGYRVEGCTRWGFLVVVNGPTEESVIDARRSWAGAARQIAACLTAPDPKGKRPRAPASLRVSEVAEGFLEPLIATRERLALMRDWDGTPTPGGRCSGGRGRSRGQLPWALRAQHPRFPTDRGRVARRTGRMATVLFAPVVAACCRNRCPQTTRACGLTCRPPQAIYRRAPGPRDTPSGAARGRVAWVPGRAVEMGRPASAFYSVPANRQLPPRRHRSWPWTDS